MRHCFAEITVKTQKESMIGDGNILYKFFGIFSNIFALI